MDRSDPSATVPVLAHPSFLHTLHIFHTDAPRIPVTVSLWNGLLSFWVEKRLFFVYNISILVLFTGKGVM